MMWLKDLRLYSIAILVQSVYYSPGFSYISNHSFCMRFQLLLSTSQSSSFYISLLVPQRLSDSTYIFLISIKQTA